VWPTPVALFVLALGLGALAYRTQSLVGPVVLHGLFNGFNCLVLFLWPQ
jgi:membrane protease YdiL (CAAX protease family)